MKVDLAMHAGTGCVFPDGKQLCISCISIASCLRLQGANYNSRRRRLSVDVCDTQSSTYLLRTGKLCKYCIDDTLTIDVKSVDSRSGYLFASKEINSSDSNQVFNHWDFSADLNALTAKYRCANTVSILSPADPGPDAVMGSLPPSKHVSLDGCFWPVYHDWIQTFCFQRGLNPNAIPDVWTKAALHANLVSQVEEINGALLRKRESAVEHLRHR